MAINKGLLISKIKGITFNKIAIANFGQKINESQ